MAAQYAAQRAANPGGHGYCSDDAWVGNDVNVGNESGGGGVPALLERAFTTLPTRQSSSLYFAMAPTSRRPLPATGQGDMALSLQTDHYFAVYAVWNIDGDSSGKGDGANDEARCREWVRSILSEVERRSAGSYLGDADFQVRRTRFWADAAAEKLRQVRRCWDPESRICGFLVPGDEYDGHGDGLGLANAFEWESH